MSSKLFLRVILFHTHKNKFYQRPLSIQINHNFNKIQRLINYSMDLFKRELEIAEALSTRYNTDDYTLANDLSKKGSIDESIRDLVNYINEQDDFVTTSSCSGRAILYTSGAGCIIGHKKSKKDCKWLYTNHDFIDPEAFLSAVDPTEGDLLFKFEPFILHVQCSNLEKAKHLHTVALGAGFRDSGLTIGKHGKIILAIRSNLRLEVPLSQDSVMLVSDIYLKFLAEQANEKMEMNQRNIRHFFIILKETFGNPNKNGNEVKSSTE